MANKWEGEDIWDVNRACIVSMSDHSFQRLVSIFAQTNISNHINIMIVAHSKPLTPSMSLRGLFIYNIKPKTL